MIIVIVVSLAVAVVIIFLGAAKISKREDEWNSKI